MEFSLSLPWFVTEMKMTDLFAILRVSVCQARLAVLDRIRQVAVAIQRKRYRSACVPISTVVRIQDEFSDRSLRWVPEASAPNCQSCAAQFSIVLRRVSSRNLNSQISWQLRVYFPALIVSSDLLCLGLSPCPAAPLPLLRPRCVRRLRHLPRRPRADGQQRSSTLYLKILFLFVPRFYDSIGLIPSLARSASSATPR